MTSLPKTNACRILDRNKIKYDLVTYSVDESDLSAIHVAESVGEDINTVFKTLILHGSQYGFFVCVIPGDLEVNLKKAANIRGEKKIAMIPMKDLKEVTGYIRGGCSPLGMKKPFPVYIDSSCVQHEFIFISAGVRGMQIKIAPADLIKVTNAVVADITE